MPLDKVHQRNYQRGYQSTPEYKAYQRKYRKKYSKIPKNISRRKHNKRVHDLKSKGWSLEKFEETLFLQKAMCPIGGHPFTKTNPPCADHQHVLPPKPRGILCSLHNAALGSFHDSVEELRLAIKYLKKHQGG